MNRGEITIIKIQTIITNMNKPEQV
jgi:hypothetical protein